MSGGYSIRDDDRGVVIALEGEIDLQNSPDLRRALLAQLAQAKTVVVDLSAVQHIDSSGIACLVEGYQLARTQATRFCLAAVSAPALRVLKLARLDEVFVLFATSDLALAGA